MPSQQEGPQLHQFKPTPGHKCRQATVVSAHYQGEARIQIACPPVDGRSREYGGNIDVAQKWQGGQRYDNAYA